MIRITFYRSRDDIINGFESLGHAGFAEAGEDIVCAGVSALVLNAVNSVEAFTEDSCEIETDEESGLISLMFTHKPSKEATLLMKSLMLGLEGIRDAYGDEFISLISKEV